MRIIEITGEPILHGGQEAFLANLLSSIDYSGISIDVLTPYMCDNDSFRELVESKGGNLYELDLKFSPGNSRRLLLEPLSNFLRENYYDAVHIHSGSISALAYCALAAKRGKTKRIIVHSHSTGIDSFKHKVIRFLFGFILKQTATDFLACSKEAGEMKYPKSIIRDKLIIIKNGIPIEKYKRNMTKRLSERKRLEISDDIFVVGHVGRFTAEKNHTFIIDLFSQVHKAIPGSKLLLVGDGELIHDMKEKVENLEMQDSVIFAGNVDNVQDYYQAMDLFILPSLYEGFSLVTLEAQAAGLPCLISTGVPEAVVISSTIERIPLNDKKRWIDKIIAYKQVEFTDNSEVIKTAGYDSVQTAKEIKAIYERNM